MLAAGHRAVTLAAAAAARRLASTSTPLRWEVGPGATLEITSRSGDVTCNNGGHTEVVVSSSTEPSSSLEVNPHPDSLDARTATVIGVVSDSASVTALHPERYCSVRALAPRGRVSVASLVEASLDARARGDVDLGSVRGVTVSASSDEGSVVCGNTSGSKVRLASASGEVSAKKVVGNAVEVNAATLVSLRSIYADAATVEGASVDLGNAGCASLVVRAAEGAKIGGITGNLRVEGGETCEVHLSRDSGVVEIVGVEREVRVTLEPGAGEVECALDAASTEMGEGASVSDCGRVLRAEGGGARPARLLDAQEGGVDAVRRELLVSSPNARLVVSASSWLSGFLGGRASGAEAPPR